MFLKSNIILVFWTLVSRMTGFVRDSVMALVLGSGVVSDCMVAAMKIPNSLRRLLGEGALSSVFTPLFSGHVANGDLNSAKNLQNAIFSILLYLLILLVIIAEIFMPEIMHYTVPGFRKNEYAMNLIVNLGRINFISIIFLCLSSLCGATLNGLRKFGYFAAVPIFLNLSLSVAFVFSGTNHINIAYINAIIFCVVCGINLLFLMVMCNHFGYRVVLKIPKITDEIKLFLKKMLNGLIGSSVYQLNILIDSIFASTIIGGMSYLYYTDRLIQLPLTLIGGTVGISLLQFFSHHIKKNETKDLNILYNNTITGVLFCLGICIAMIFAIGDYMVSFVYKRGVFTQTDVAIVVKMMQIFSISLIFSVLSRVYNAFLFAKLDTKSPMWIGIIGLAVNTVINALTYKTHGYYCVAYASSTAAVVCFLCSYLCANRYKILILEKRTIRSILLIIFTGFAVYFAVRNFKYLLTGIPSFPALLILGFTGVVIYISMIILFKVYSLKDMKLLFAKKKNVSSV